MRIAVWNTAFLGDALLTLPLMQALRQTWPQARLDLYVRAGVGSLFAAQNLVQHVEPISSQDRSPAGMIRLARRIASQSYDVWIGAHESPRSSLLAAASGAAMRIGYKRAWHRELAYTHTVDRCFGSLDEIERLLELLRPLEGMARARHSSMEKGGWHTERPWPPQWPDVWPVLDIPEAVEREADKFWRTLPSGPVLGLHPGSVWATKRWTAGGFADIARRALDAGAQVVIFAGPDEVSTAAEVLRCGDLQGHPAVTDCSGALSLVQLAAWLKRLDCYVSNDSGPMHLAWLQHVPVVALFGPTVREWGFFPRGNARVVETETSLDCRPCGLHGPQLCPRGDHACMTTIDRETVWKAVRERLYP